jgi:hypothetical protein
MMKTRLTFLFAFLVLGCLSLSARSVKAAPGPSDESDVRATVQRVFDQLKSDNTRRSMTDYLQRLVHELLAIVLSADCKRTSDFYRLDRIEIGAVRVSGNLAVVDTTMFAHVNKPLDADGKLVVQQYLVREDGNWRVATGDNATVNRFLKANPTFARRFPIKRPHAFVYQNGKWVEIPLGRR